MQNSSSTGAFPIATLDIRERVPVRVQGRMLLVLRVSWIVFAVLFLSMFIVAIPVAYDTYRHPSHDIFTSLTRTHVSITAYALYTIVLQLLYVVGYCFVAFVIFWRRSDEVIGLYVSFFLLAFGIASNPIVYALPNLSLFWVTPVNGINVIGWGLFAPFFYLFPDGRFVPRWTRWMAIVSVLYQIFWIFPQQSPVYTGRWPIWFFIAVEFSLGITCIASPIYRYVRVSSRIQRQQTKWVLYCLIFSLCIYVLSIVLGSVFPASGTAFGPIVSLFAPDLVQCVYLIVPFSILIAIFRYRLWDIDILINRTLVYAILSACIVALYALVVVLLGAIFQSKGNVLISLIATAIIALCFQPLRERLQKIVNRLMFGERDNPYRVLSQLGQRLEATLASDEVLPAIVETVACSLKLPYAAIRLRQEELFVLAASYRVPTAKDKLMEGVTASSPHPEIERQEMTLNAKLVYLPLTYQSEAIGELVLAPRASGEAFNSAEQQLLTELARQAGIAVHGVLVTADLERSRQKIVAAREEARRSLGSNLHDGLGHVLASALRKAENTERFIGHDTVAAQKSLLETKQHMRAAIENTRSLAHSLHPPGLELLGLVKALQEESQQYNEPDGLHVTVEIPRPLPLLPIAIESAAYYIALEALHNIHRHAHAHHCVIRLGVLVGNNGVGTVAGIWNTATLALEIRDDGVGLPQDTDSRSSGLGLTSMRERAAELGGLCMIETNDTGGTRVYARLPYRQEKDLEEI